MGEHFLPGCCVPLRLRVLRELRNCALALLMGLIFYGDGDLVRGEEDGGY